MCHSGFSALLAVCAVRRDSSQGSRFLYVDVWGAGVSITLVSKWVIRLTQMCAKAPGAFGNFNSRVPEGKIKDNKEFTNCFEMVISITVCIFWRMTLYQYFNRGHYYLISSSPCREETQAVLYGVSEWIFRCECIFELARAGPSARKTIKLSKDDAWFLNLWCDNRMFSGTRHTKELWSGQQTA